MCIELATQKGWRRYAFPRFISFILRNISAKQKGIVMYYGSFES